MKKIIGISLFCISLLGAVLATTGCSFVSSAQPGLTTATGEAWYTKDKYFLFIPLGSDIYYCPANTGQCFEASIQ